MHTCICLLVKSTLVSENNAGTLVSENNAGKSMQGRVMHVHQLDSGSTATNHA